MCIVPIIYRRFIPDLYLRYHITRRKTYLREQTVILYSLGESPLLSLETASNYIFMSVIYECKSYKITQGYFL